MPKPYRPSVLRAQLTPLESAELLRALAASHAGRDAKAMRQSQHAPAAREAHAVCSVIVHGFDIRVIRAPRHWCHPGGAHPGAPPRDVHLVCPGCKTFKGSFGPPRPGWD